MLTKALSSFAVALTIAIFIGLLVKLVAYISIKEPQLMILIMVFFIFSLFLYSIHINLWEE